MSPGCSRAGAIGRTVRCAAVLLSVSVLAPSVPAQTCTTDLVSKSSPIGTANGGSGQQYITANGRYVAFVSHGRDLPGVPVPANNTAKVYVFDVMTHALSLVSAG